MADKHSKEYPLPRFHFQVDWGADFHIGFTEVTGLSFETEVIEYREGNSPQYIKRKQAGMQKLTNVTAKRGVFKGDDDLYKEFAKTVYFQEGNKPGSLYRRTVTISLLDETHQPIIVWKLQNAWLSKVQSPDLKADASEVAIETMEIVHEGLSVEFVK